jgi:hypothetical protein
MSTHPSTIAAPVLIKGRGALASFFELSVAGGDVGDVISQYTRTHSLAD